ncbi:phage head-tail connector protein [Methylobacterium sp. 22177]|uniref:phage head-tail connector protein n=1 Tax=Methylobacterium sp. 22177 TaxID=3453885 RepID=UPI003F87B243
MIWPSSHDLVRLADLGVQEDADGAVQRLITAVSRMILTALNRPAILPRRYTEVRTGGTGRILLANWPVTGIEAVTVGSTAIAAAEDAGSRAGYTLQPADEAPPGRPQVLTLPGRPGCAAVSVTYTAGYRIAVGPVPIPGGAPCVVYPDQPYGAWACDLGVAFGTGAALTQVDRDPAQGQYAVTDAGSYLFSAEDVGEAVAITYGYVPADLANAALDWIRDRMAYAERVGMQSKSLGGQETVSYRIAAVPDFVSAALQPYRAVVPPC